jgi:hypothetical protein
MYFDFLIADHVIRAEDSAVAEFMDGFECESEKKSASDGKSQEPICSVFCASELSSHGVECMTPGHAVSHVLGLTRDHTGVLMADDCFEHMTLRTRREEFLGEVLLPGVYSRLIYFGTTFHHGALIHIPGYGGVMFVGPSRIGKTTQAMIWEMLRGAEIINGDKVFLGLREDHPGEVMAYGSPWQGSSPYRVNKRVPLKAVVSLRRQSEKYIRPLTEEEALTVLMTSTYLPNWDARLMAHVMDSIGEMLPLLSMYEMSCLPDGSGVDMVAGMIGL